MAATGRSRPTCARAYGVDVAHVPNAWDPDLEPASRGRSRRAGGRVALVHTGKLSGGWGRDPRALFAGLRRLLDEQPELRERCGW